MGFVAAAIIGASAISAGASAYSSSKQATASKKAAQTAADSQERIAAQEIAAVKEGETLAKDTATSKLKLRRASQTKTILTSPFGVQTDEEQINKPGLGTV